MLHLSLVFGYNTGMKYLKVLEELDGVEFF